MLKTKIAAALVVSAALAPGAAVWLAADATAEPYTIDEQSYLEVMDEYGIESGLGPDGLLRAGYAVCQRLSDGKTEFATIKELYAANEGMTSKMAAQVVGAASAAFCPEFMGDGIGF